MATNKEGAIAAAREVVAGLELSVRDAVVLHASNRLSVRLLPCDVLARVADAQMRASAEFEIRMALRLAERGAPIRILAPRVAPVVHERDGFIVTLWTYHDTEKAPAFAPADYARALEQLHVCMRLVDTPTPHFTDRISDAQQLVEDRLRTPGLTGADRALLSGALETLRRTIIARNAREQLLHGEAHPGNVLPTKEGLLFIDLETCCRGPVEFDLAHLPEITSAYYPHADERLVRECRMLTLALVTAWRWDRDDRFPGGLQAGRAYLNALKLALSGGPVRAPAQEP